MKLNCSQSELNAALQLVSRAVSNRPTHPVLANVLLAADEVTGKLRLTGFDLSLGYNLTLYDPNGWEANGGPLAGKQELGLSRPFFRISLLFGG